jgi:hypothetical protein
MYTGPIVLLYSSHETRPKMLSSNVYSVMAATRSSPVTKPCSSSTEATSDAVT